MRLSSIIIGTIVGKVIYYIHCVLKAHKSNKKINDLDDFEDTSRPPITDWVENMLQAIFVTAGVSMFVYITWLAVKAIYL